MTIIYILAAIALNAVIVGALAYLTRGIVGNFDGCGNAGDE